MMFISIVFGAVIIVSTMYFGVVGGIAVALDLIRSKEIRLGKYLGIYLLCASFTILTVLVQWSELVTAYYGG